MPVQIEALEVDQFTTAIAGLEVDYVRTGSEHDACRMTAGHDAEVRLSTGRMGFSTLSYVEVPHDITVISLITSAPPGGSWCGVSTEVGSLNVYGPGTPFVGVNPAGICATFLVTPTSVLTQSAYDLRLGDLSIPRSVVPLADQPHVLRLKQALWRLTVDPGQMDDPTERKQLIDSAVMSIATKDAICSAADRRLDSRRIVLDCINFVESTQSLQPSMSELCRAACASESRVRQAFVEVLDTPPTQFFQYRLLSQLREQLLHADPRAQSVSRIASSLGVTQLGRIAGRYRRLYEELPSETLRRSPRA
jgi:AraC-like DNA-binding protein